MADKKISQLTNITGANLADTDEFVVVDSSADETKAITWSELKEGLDTGTGFVRITGDTMTGDLSFNGGDTIYGDNDKAIFGAGSDLQIYSDGTNSWIEEHGGGDLYIEATNLTLRALDNTVYATFTDAGPSTLNHAGSQKLATTSTGVNITGEIEADTAHFGTGTGTGTSVADEVVVSGTASTGLTIHSPDASNATLAFGSVTDNSYAFVQGYYNAGSPFLRFSIQNSEIAKVTSTGIDVTGTVTADALTVDGGTTTEIKVFSQGRVNPTTLSEGASGAELMVGSSNPLTLGTAGLDRLTVASNGDISFFEDTGTTPKFHWSASAESLGIGTVIPYSPLHLSTAGLTQARFESTGTSGSYVQFRDADTTAGQSAWIGSDGDLFKFYSNNNTLNMAMTTAGNVGIGTTSPAYKTVISANGASGIEFGPAYSGTSNLVQHYSRSGGVYVDAVVEAAQHRFHISGTERMRLDASGNLLVGKNNDADTNVGARIRADGLVQATRNNADPLSVNRTGTDGDIAVFRKDGTTVGSIGVLNGDNLRIGGSATDHAGLQFGTNIIYPESGPSSNITDGLVDLGNGSGRFKDLYLSGGVYLGGIGAANKLDDYETGYFEPNIQPASGSITWNTDQNKLSYTKIGRLVHITGQLAVSSVSSPSGITRGSLPFTQLDQDEQSERTTGVALVQNTSLNVNEFGIYPNGGSDTFLEIVRTNATSIQRDAGSYFNSSTVIQINYTYVAA